MARLRVLLTDYAWNDVDVESQLLGEIDAELVVAEHQDAVELARLAKDVDGILTCWAQVSSEVIDAAPKCRVISRLGVGLDNIDVEAATSRRIVVTNVPDYCVTEVAEHTLALILALGRNIAFYHQQTKSGQYDLNAGPPLRRLHGQTLGILGLGRIGREVARRGMALGLKVIAASHRRGRSLEGVQWRQFQQLLSESDFVSLHLPLRDTTQRMMGEAEFAQMKPTAFLINTARGGLVDHEALATALPAGQIAGAALDVQDPEPPDLSKPPWNDPRVIVTPHAAFASKESLLELRQRATRNLIDVLNGRKPENVVNPSVFKE